MPKVTSERMTTLLNSGCFPPRHQIGCPKNYARTFPMILAAKGYTIKQIKERVTREAEALPCTCK